MTKKEIKKNTLHTYQTNMTGYVYTGEVGDDDDNNWKHIYINISADGIELDDDYTLGMWIEDDDSIEELADEIGRKEAIDFLEKKAIYIKSVYTELVRAELI